MPPKLRLQGQEVEWQTRVRHLSVQIDRSMPMTAQGYIRSRLTYAAPGWYALCSASQSKKIQAQQNIALRMIVEARWYVLNDARDLCMRLDKRILDIADQGYEFLRNIVSTQERSLSGRPLPRELLRIPPPKN
ncbi:hypothetical protein EVAR_84629_1 [Eumeta japonica]|uniref:Uncharacterized protein n=1 Tax=Eumeta variegata TaxID=151549 RepID=A0A4C1UZS8_EUMVA|nr:hypothetical protein EVAR_84629_1 [Eumeta japonica]